MTFLTIWHVSDELWKIILPLLDELDPPHIRRIDEEKLDEKQEKGYLPRRWVVERTLAWLSKCRALLVRYNKKSENFLALIQLACSLLWYRRFYRLNLR
jgi:putative transposase